MRTIKFRGKNILTGEWVYGTGIHVTDDKVHINVDSPFGYEVTPATVGQFTGLQDANGTDVYEGDIVRYRPNNKTYQVVFKDGIFWGEGNNGHGCAAHFFPSCEILGNVFDNPELIKKGGKQ